MKYICEMCGFSSDTKDIHNKHLKTAHVENTQTTTMKKYKCDVCLAQFSHRQGLSYHKLHTCKGIIVIVDNSTNTNDDIIDMLDKYRNQTGKIDMSSIIENYETVTKQLVIQNKQLLEQNKNYTDFFMEYVKTNKAGNTYISVKNYLQQNYADAPALESLPDYDTVKYNDETCEEDDDFADTLTYNYNNKYLHKFLGNFIIHYYKKNDPRTQSMWSSDISRLTYIIKELLANQKSIWAHDYKGAKTKVYIIDPLLKYIRNYIDEYWINKLETYKTSKIHEFNRYHKIYTTLYKIKKDIDTDFLGNEIIKYIAPHFYMDRTIKENNKDNV